jgi:hypothetical protein
MRATLTLACLMLIVASFVLASCSGTARYKTSGKNPAHTQTTVAKKGPPPHAPAHGYRHKHGDVVLVYESSLSVYIVHGYEGHYFSDGDYYRMHKGGWQVSVDIGGPWRKISETKVPKGLHGEYHAKAKKKK